MTVPGKVNARRALSRRFRTGLAALFMAIVAPSLARADGSAPAKDSCDDKVLFKADPLADVPLLVASLGFAGLSEAIISTGEIRPQQIDAAFDTKRLLSIDRAAITQTVDTTASGFSNGGVYAMLGFAVFDSVASGFRAGQDAALVDLTLYSEAIAFSWGLTNLAKIGFRRPRPIAYIERNRAIQEGQDPAKYNNTSTDSTLSFYSGHTAIAATVSATATYLAFARSPHTLRPWATLAGAVTLTSFVAVERVRSGAHFPTDVIAGAFAGAGIGMLVVHLHRYDSETRRPVWVGALPVEGGGGVMVGGRF
ncbi:MAG TPA: phosphatase PAP2 family protein [Polyangiaceae bacterium]|nr:phosphatase PAP2 family protein [Polyangiaceae bacterium]